MTLTLCFGEKVSNPNPQKFSNPNPNPIPV